MVYRHPAFPDRRPNCAKLHLSHWVKPGPVAVHLWRSTVGLQRSGLSATAACEAQVCLRWLVERFGNPAVLFRYRNPLQTTWRYLGMAEQRGLAW